LQNRYTDWGRQHVGILQDVPLYGLDAVEAACRKALGMGASIKEVVLNLLNRSRDDAAPAQIEPPGYLRIVDNQIHFFLDIFNSNEVPLVEIEVSYNGTNTARK